MWQDSIRLYEDPVCWRYPRYVSARAWKITNIFRRETKTCTIRMKPPLSTLKWGRLVGISIWCFTSWAFTLNVQYEMVTSTFTDQFANVCLGTLFVKLFVWDMCWVTNRLNNPFLRMATCLTVVGSSRKIIAKLFRIRPISHSFRSPDFSALNKRWCIDFVFQWLNNLFSLFTVYNLSFFILLRWRLFLCTFGVPVQAYLTRQVAKIIA